MRRVAFLPHPAPLSHLQTLLEDGTRLFVQDQLRSKLLQRAFSKRSHIQFDSQCYLPLQVEGGPTSGFVIRNPVIRLQHQRGGQQARRHTRPPVVAAVECGEVFVTEQLIPLRGKEPVEVLPPNEVSVQRVRLEHTPLRRPLTEHSPYAPFRSDLLRLPYPATLPHHPCRPEDSYPFPAALLGRVHRLRLLHALFAASVGGCVMASTAVGLLAIVGVLGGVVT